jgi:hypothetical protein
MEGFNMFNKLMAKVEYAKTTMIPLHSLYETYGEIKMAFKLKAITKDEFMELNTACVRNGINNPKYFDR